MKRSLGWFVLCAGAAATAAVVGCSSDSGDDGGGSGGGTASCRPLAPECYIAGPDGPGNECLAKRDNSTATTAQLRISQLEVKSPNALTQPFMQDQIVTKKITLNQDKCFQFGDAQYNWLFDVDVAGNKVISGGGPPQRGIGAPEDGTCFANFTDDSGIEVNQVEAVTATITGNDVDADFERFVIPIYIDDKVDNYALLPVNKLNVKFTMSADKNCVGRFKHETLDPKNTCRAAGGEFAWENAGSFAGYITVAEADTVMISSLGFTLCVLLSQDTNTWKGPMGTCASSTTGMTGALPKGDWCAATNDDSCADKDAWNLVGNFAAASIEITGDCP